MRYLLQLYSLFFALVAICADWFSKHWVLEKYGSGFGSYFSTEITPFFNITLVYNRGISFGLFSDSGGGLVWFFGILSVVVSLVLGVMMFRSRDSINVLSFGLIIGGALGNVLDRISYGAVIDFLDFHLFGYHWPAFNLADSFIFVGVFVLLLGNLKLTRG